MLIFLLAKRWSDTTQTAYYNILTTLSRLGLYYIIDFLSNPEN